jgi:hypothetical protein
VTDDSTALSLSSANALNAPVPAFVVAADDDDDGVEVDERRE